MLDEATDFCRLILLRHPELDPSAADRATGAGDAPLGRRGQAQLLHLLGLLQDVRVDRVYSADQQQCRDAAQTLAAHKQVELCREPRLGDQDMGSWQGRLWEDLAREEGAALQTFFSQFGEVAPPGGESLGQAIERMLAWWTETASGALGKSLAVVAAGSMISGFAAAMLGLRLSRSVSLNLPHGGVGILECFGNGARIASWNSDALSVP